MLTLAVEPNDDAAFLEAAARLIHGAARANLAADVETIRIDHWFGDRWLGFRGVWGGRWDDRSRRGRNPGVPPFHPNRVEAARFHTERSGSGFDRGVETSSPHGWRPSHVNVFDSLRRDLLYAWYSGDTRRPAEAR